MVHIVHTVQCYDVQMNYEIYLEITRTFEGSVFLKEGKGLVPLFLIFLSLV